MMLINRALFNVSHIHPPDLLGSFSLFVFSQASLTSKNLQKLPFSSEISLVLSDQQECNLKLLDDFLCLFSSQHEGYWQESWCEISSFCNLM